jgi:hypothetical protein
VGFWIGDNPAVAIVQLTQQLAETEFGAGDVYAVVGLDPSEGPAAGANADGLHRDRDDPVHD